MDTEEQPWGKLQLFLDSNEGYHVFTTLSGPQVWIGKDDNCDVVLRHPYITSKHFKLSQCSSPNTTSPLAILSDNSNGQMTVIRAGTPATNVPMGFESPRNIVLGSGDIILIPTDPGDLDWSSVKIIFWSMEDYETLNRADSEQTDESQQSIADGTTDSAASVSSPDAAEQGGAPTADGFSIPIAQNDFEAELQRVLTPQPASARRNNARINSTGSNSSRDDDHVSMSSWFPYVPVRFLRNNNNAPTPSQPTTVQQNNAVEGDRLPQLENLLDQLVEVYTCSICMELIYDPVASTNCMHVFCGGCLSRWMFRTSGNRTDCPKCRTRIEVVMPSREWAHLYPTVSRLRPNADRSEEERACMDESNSFRGHGRFVVEDRVNQELMADIERITMSLDDATSAIVSTAGPSSSNRNRNRNNRDAGVIVLNTSPFVRTPSPLVARPRYARNVARPRFTHVRRRR